MFGLAFVFAAISHVGRMQDLTNRLWLLLGGEDFIALLSAQVLLGMTWGWLSRKIQRLTVLVMAGILWLVLLVVVVSPLVWRYGGAAALNRLPNNDGILKQALPFTCGPAAAAMLLNRKGVKVTEGELALSSRTTILFGTNDYALARAMAGLAARKGVEAKVRIGSAEESARFPTPFIAGVSHPKWGDHEILVESFRGDAVHIVDPYKGKRERFTLKQWEEMWHGRAIVVTKGS